MAKKLNDKRRQEIFDLVRQGYNNVQISSMLGMCRSTVSHQAAMFRQCGGFTNLINKKGSILHMMPDMILKQTDFRR